MHWILQAISTGTTAFVATNLDDLILLTILFSQVHFSQSNRVSSPPRIRLRICDIVMGQYLGFSILVLASLPGILGGLILPRPWLGLLGLLPIAIGLNQLLHQEPESTVQQVNVTTLPDRSQQNSRKIAALLSSPIGQVAAITVANGGDNLGIYLPLFANQPVATVGLILVVFFGLVGIWCAIAYVLTRHPVIVKVLARYGHLLLPIVLIGLGIMILVESQTLTLLSKGL
ncbi:cadmium resistance transporter [Alkalinema pantanalense CENA528]|uniref:cadmium resistance transporter n=1 Tax=Alkalinema pantanalense TaxID=1620705 RepID=UPI003D6FFB87